MQTPTPVGSLSSDQADLKDMTRRLALDRYAPHAQAWDRDYAHFPDEERQVLADLDLLGIALPEEYGGSGRPLVDALIVIEELAKATPLAAFPVFEAATGPARVIELCGTEEQKAEHLPPVVQGRKTIAVAISEPDAGSAATDATVRGRVEGDELVISGTKRWCSGAGYAEQYLVYLRLGPEKGAAGLGAVLVDRDAEQLSFGEQEHLMGHRGVGSADMFFDDVRVPIERLIIPQGGFKHLFSVFSIERLGNATMSLALAQAALDRSARYVQERKQFGRAIAEFQMVQGTLADMIMQVDAARLLVHRAATNAGHGVPIPREASIAKCFSNETAKRVTDMAIQLHGGYGYSAEYDVERMHRDAHGWALAGGTPNMQRIRIASDYLERRFDQRS